MSNPTSYLVLVAGTEVDRKSKKDRAIEIAEGLRAENPDAIIEVQTSAGNVVHTVKVKGTHTKPWTRTETHDGIEVEVPAGYEVAYTRKRVGAVVARSEAKDGWLVLTEDGKSLEAKNTIEAREITNQLAAEHAEKRAAEKKAEAEKKADAKVKREAERAEKAAQKERDRAEKAAAKAAEQEPQEEAASVA